MLSGVFSGECIASKEIQVPPIRENADIATFVDLYELDLSHGVSCFAFNMQQGTHE